jgi:hypothetical protein
MYPVFVSHAKGAVHTRGPVISLLFTGANCIRDGVQPWRVPRSAPMGTAPHAGLELQATKGGGYTLRPADQRHETA